MTLIAFVCKDDKAEILTDSLAYTRNLANLGSSNKVALLPNLDAAIMTNGDGVFGGHVKAMALTTTGLLTDHTFDGLTREIQPALQDFWRQVSETAKAFVFDSTVFLVGYSADAGHFTSYLYASGHDFEPEPVEGLYLSPMPGKYRPSQLELDRMRLDYPDDPAATALDEWAAQPECPVPGEDLSDWVRLGLESRYSRAVQDFGKVLVGGSLYFTRLERGLSMTSQIYDFDDTGDELLALVGYSQHPVAQKRPCWCGSGKRHLDCHLAEFLDEPCGCGRDLVFRDCCMVRDG
jgi:hypothetical protein